MLPRTAWAQRISMEASAAPPVSCMTSAGPKLLPSKESRASPQCAHLPECSTKADAPPAQELLPLTLAGALSSSARFTVIFLPSTILLCSDLMTPSTTVPSENSQKP